MATWRGVTLAVRETQDLLLPKKKGFKRKPIKPSQDTLRLEKRLREEGGNDRELKRQLGTDLRACRKRDAQLRDQSILTEMKRAFENDDVGEVAACMDRLSGASKFCTVQPMFK